MEFLRLLESIRNPVLDHIFQFITLFGQEAFVLAILCFLYWNVNKTTGYQLALSYFSAGLLVQTLKITFRVPRPWIIDPEFKPVESAIKASTGYSFPSGHTQGGTSLFCTFLAHTKQKSLKVLCVLAFVLIGFSRLYLGVHTPGDVLVSMALSMCMAYLVYRFMHKYAVDSSRDLFISVVLAMISISVMAFAFYLYKKGTIDAKYARDCCKAGGAGLGFAAGWYTERAHIKFPVKTRTIRGQIIKFTAGISCLLVLKEGLKLVVGTAIWSDMIRYFLLVLWIVIAYPVIIKKVCRHLNPPGDLYC